MCGRRRVLFVGGCLRTHRINPRTVTKCAVRRTPSSPTEPPQCILRMPGYVRAYGDAHARGGTPGLFRIATLSKQLRSVMKTLGCRPARREKTGNALIRSDLKALFFLGSKPCSRLMLTQNRDDLLFRKPLSLHQSVLQPRPDLDGRNYPWQVRSALERGVRQRSTFPKSPPTMSHIDRMNLNWQRLVEPHLFANDSNHSGRGFPSGNHRRRITRRQP